MSIIATMKKLENGSFEGKIKTALINCHLRLQPIDDEESANNKRPDYRAKVGGYEAGAAWKKVSENGNPYLSVRIEDPALPRPINANLIEHEGEYLLIWSHKD